MKSLLLIGSLGLSLWGTEILGCSCMPPGSPQEELAESTAVFSGKAMRVDVEGDEFTGNLKVTFRVSKVWKGQVRRYVTIKTARQGSMCGYHFQTPEKYVIYAYADQGGVLGTNLCTRTKPLSQAEEDLAGLGEGQPPSLGID